MNGLIDVIAGSYFGFITVQINIYLERFHIFKD